ncbi:UDP-N-acetylglucosamine 1-carboxyvinyltransferase, partial [Candidatus Gottesmanbacteria bacterium]|nr:UDP-N-acetylglucosamine 1-carboxyvinyltransferase [Candidatus Gottesmanbacteria bacterium]
MGDAAENSPQPAPQSDQPPVQFDQPPPPASPPPEPDFDREKVIVEKGELKGVVEVGGAKNCGPKLMIAACLAQGTTTLRNMPVIGDVKVTAEILESLGAKVSYGENDTIVIVVPDAIDKWVVPETAGEVSRISILAAGMLLARFGKAEIPLPGGDKIGRRPVDIHLEGLKALGARIDEISKPGWILLSAEGGLTGCDYRLKLPSHTATENLVMAATRATGKTTLRNCAREPEVDALVAHLNNAGAKINITEPTDPAGERIIEIEGVPQMHGADTQVIADRNAVVTYAVAALTSGSREGVFIKNAETAHIGSFLELITEMGGSYEENDGGIRFYMAEGAKLRAPKRTVITCPHPGISNEKYLGVMTDWQALVSALFMTAEGDTRLIETMYPSRFHHLEALQTADPGLIEFFNPKIFDPAIKYIFTEDPSQAHHGAIIHGKGKESLPQISIEGKDVRLGAFGILYG